MRRLGVLVFSFMLACAVLAGAPRFVIDDDDYVDKVLSASSKLLEAGKLVPLDTLRGQVRKKRYAVQSPPVAVQKLEAPELYERLRSATLAVGTFFKCADCGEWHFNSSAGFAVGAGGIVCTCCHVVTAEDDKVEKGYLVAADSEGHVFPVRSVVAADTEADTCFLKVEAPGLKALPLRSDVRTGERVYCLGHPGGYYFMFTQGMVARLNLKRNDMLDEHGHTNGLVTRPVLFLNVTTEFAPGSSGGPVVDEAGNVVGQVASIADAGEPPEGDDNGPASPSVPVRFCTAAEEILRLTHEPVAHGPKAKAAKQQGAGGRR